LANHLALAQRLIEQKDYAGALPHLEKAHPMEPEHSQVMYSLAVCYKELGQPDKGMPLLQRIISRDRTWSDYAAWRTLVETHEEKGNKESALKTCRDLVKLAPSLRHRCLLAEHLLTTGQGDEARQLLDQALLDHYYAPGPLRRRNRHWASEARRLQKQC
jgi:tetratricopeptide (TPR) repeat protein